MIIMILLAAALCVVGGILIYRNNKVKVDFMLDKSEEIKKVIKKK